MIRVLIVDDHDLVRAGMHSILSQADGIVVAGECTDGEQVLAAVGAVTPDVVLMDRQMPVTSGAEATRALLAIHPTAKVLMMSVAGTDRRPPGGCRGRRGRLRDQERKLGHLIAAIRAVAAGGLPGPFDAAEGSAQGRLPAILTTAVE